MRTYDIIVYNIRHKNGQRCKSYVEQRGKQGGGDLYDKVNSLAPAFERTQPATLLLGLKMWLLDMTGGTCTSMAAPYRALHARAEKIKEKR